MKKLAAIWITLVLTLSAFVPIPQQAPPETKAGLSDLASVFAKWDTQDDTTEYMELLTEFEQCVHDLAEDYGSWTYTDSEMTAQVIYPTAVLMAAASMERSEKVESGELNSYFPDGESRKDQYSLTHLKWVLAYCEDSGEYEWLKTV